MPSISIESALLALILAVDPAAERSVPVTAPPAELCGGPEANLRCLERNFEAFHAMDYQRFWKILDENAPSPKECVPNERTVEFLSLARVKSSSAEFEEFLAKRIENLCAKAPECFRKASEQLDPEGRERLRRMLETPVFLEREALARGNCLGDPALARRAPEALGGLCPREIATRQQLALDMRGWESYSRFARHTLREVQFFDGHPSKLVALHPDDEVEAKIVALWRLHAEVEYWVQCGYSGTSVVLSKRLPPGVTRCEVTWAPHYREVENLVCM